MEAPLILSHESALLYHRAARLGRPPRVDDVAALAAFIGTTSKLDVLVPTADKRLRGSWAHSHVCAGIDTDALALPAANGIRVCVPELALWQLAQRGDVVRTALLAYELCGTFAIDADAPDGFVRGIAPLTSRGRIESLVPAMPGSACSRASIALRRVLDTLADGAASPAEAKLCLAMVAPRLSGGFGLPRPLLNSPIVVSGMGHGLTEKRTVYPDALWEKEGLILEYQGAYHAMESRIESDAGRDNALLAMGYRVIHVTRRQVNDYDLYQGLMEAIRLALGVRLALPSPRMLERREALWRRLYGVRRGERQPFSVR